MRRKGLEAVWRDVDVRRRKKAATLSTFFDDDAKDDPADGCCSILSPYLNFLFDQPPLASAKNEQKTGLLLRPAHAPRPSRRGRREAPRLDDAPGRAVHEGKISYFVSFQLKTLIKSLMRRATLASANCIEKTSKP